MLTLTFLVKTLIDLYVMVLLLRIWMQWSRCDFYNPVAQFVVKVTQPIVKPLSRKHAAYSRLWGRLILPRCCWPLC